MNIKDVIKRHPVSIYFSLAFTISWAGIFLAVGGLKGLQGSEARPFGQILLVFLAMAAGPSLTSILLTGIMDGRDGLRRLISQLGHWRVNLGWYGAAFFIFPLLLTVIFFLLTLFSPVFISGIIKSSDKFTLLGLGIVVSLAAGFFEELGWTGFALSKLQLKHSALAAALFIGVLHGIWHFLSDYWGNAGFSGFYGTLYLVRFFLWIVALTAFRVLVTWIYNNSGSLLLAQLMHASFTGGQYILEPSRSSAANEVLWYAIFTAGLWVIVAIILVTTGAKRLVRDPVGHVKMI